MSTGPSVLRAALLGFAGLLTLCGLVCGFVGSVHAWPLTIWGLLLLAAVLLERWRYRQHAAADGDWKATGERFLDPETGRLTQVLYHPRSGERRYVAVTDETGR